MLDETTEQKTERQARLSKAMGAMFLQDKVEKLERDAEQSGSSRGVRKTQSGSSSFAARATTSHPPRSFPRASTGPGSLHPASLRTEVTPRMSVRIVDASVLIFSLRTVHTWDKDGSKTCVIVPLEAINTLDLLKKGEEPVNLAARKATRWLEERMRAAPSENLLLHPQPGIFAQQQAQTASQAQLEQRRLQCLSLTDDSSASDSFAPSQAARHLRELLSICLHCQETVAPKYDFAVSVAYAPIHLQAQLLEHPGLPASLTYAPRIDGRATEAWLDAYRLPSELVHTSKSWTGERSSAFNAPVKQASDFGSVSVLKSHHRSPQLGSFGPDLRGNSADDAPVTITSRPKSNQPTTSTDSPAKAKTAAEKMEDYLKRLAA